jgi:hypothetical protein
MVENAISASVQGSVVASNSVHGRRTIAISIWLVLPDYSPFDPETSVEPISLTSSNCSRLKRRHPQGDQTSRSLNQDVMCCSKSIPEGIALVYSLHPIKLSAAFNRFIKQLMPQMIDRDHSMLALEEDWARCWYDARLLFIRVQRCNLGSEEQC